MIIATSSSPVLSEGEMEQSVFSIKATQKALKILTSNLYSNPVRAILQELGQNSLDSLIVAGKQDTPFTIHLPTQMQPWFSTKDKGIGMTHEFMMKGYTRVFESTKDKSNALTGGFGIGKLSFLAITDAYTVICHDGKTRREYSVFFNEQGVPTIALLVEEPDTEERGVEVKAPVPRNLHAQFQQEARDHVYKFYKVKPIVKGGAHWDGFPELEYTMKADDGVWAFFKDSYQVSTAVMGVYHFPIQADSINKLNDEQRALIESGIVLHVPLGDMDTSSNRESLYYNDKTNATLKRLLDRAQHDLSLHIQKEFDKVTSLLEAKYLYFNYFRSGGLANKIGRILGEKPVVNFNGTKITDCILELTDGTTAYSFIKQWARRNEVVRKTDYTEDIMLQPSVSLFEADGRYGSRVKHLARTASGKDMAIVIIFKDAAAKDLFYKTNGLDKASVFTLTSTLPTPPRSENAEKKVIIFSLDEKTVVTHGYYRGNQVSEYWNGEMVEGEGDDADDEVPASFEDIDEKNPVYLIIDRFLPQGFDRDFSRLASTLTKLRAIGPTLGTIYGIRKSAEDAAKKAGWVPFTVAAKPLVDIYFATNHGYEAIEFNSDMQRFVDKKLERLVPGLAKAQKRAKEIQEINSEVLEMDRLARLCHAKVPARQKDDTIKDMKADIAGLYLKYPMLGKMLMAYQFDKKDIEDYIELVDKVG